MGASAKSKNWDLRQLQMHLSKNAPEGVFFLVGEESYLVQESLQCIKQEFVKNTPAFDFNYDQVFACDRSGQEVADLVQTLPVMSERRMVVIRGAQVWKEKEWTALLPVLQQPMDSCLVVIEAEKIDRRKKWVKKLGSHIRWVELKPPYDNQLAQWIHYIAGQQELNLTQDQVQWIHHYVGSRLVDIRNELIKLKQYLGDKQSPTLEDLQQVMSHSRTQTVFELTDAIGARQKKRALAAFNNLMEQGQNEVGVVQMIARHIRLLDKTKRLLDQKTPQDEFAKQLGVHKFFLSKYQQQARLWEKSRLSRATQDLFRIDGHLKSSVLPGRLFIEDMLTSL